MKKEAQYYMDIKSQNILYTIFVNIPLYWSTKTHITSEPDIFSLNQTDIIVEKPFSTLYLVFIQIG